MTGIRLFSFVLLCLVMTGKQETIAADSTPIVATATRLPAYLLEMPDSVTDILIANTESATMHRFVRSGGRIIEQDQRYMSIGLNGAGKQRAWDKKTPLGVYFITERLDTSKLDDKYGVAAFPLDYPNAWDRHNQRTGYGIWLHGVDHKNPQRPPLDTDGCLALPNDEILRLADELEPLVTPIIVARELTWTTADELEKMRLEFRLALDMWRQSLAEGDLLTYLSLYADEFRYRDMDRDDWSSYRLSVFEARQLEDVTLNDVMLLADPEAAGLFLSRFTQILVTDSGPVRTTKRLYWRRSDGNTWRIVAEDAG
jgi:murein L,D-transpeptidase YafK